MTPGDRILYRAGSRRRERLAFVKELSACGRYVKVLKVWRLSWLPKSDVVKVLPKEPEQPTRPKFQLKLI